MKPWILALGLALAGATSARAAAPPTPLFANDEPIRLTIRGPIQALVNKRGGGPRAGTLTAPDGTYPIALTPRGITRLRGDICQFPPLRVEFTQPPPAGSLFHGQRRLKLVTHCKQSGDFQQKVLLEYAAYRLYNLLTPISFRARLANIDYVDDSGRPYVSRIGFFIEDLDDVARRNGMTAARLGSRVPLQQIEPTAGARMAVFNYMISNYDWSMRAGPEGEACCHNGRLLSGHPSGLYTPLPYDFDFSGLVDAPYAGPPPGVPIDNLRERTYRGYCVHMPQATAAAAQMAARRSEFIGVFGAIPGMSPSTQRRGATFLEGFFRDVDTGKIFKNCLN